MTTLNITKSILSISTPGTTLYPSSASDSASLTRSCNSYAANVKRTHPGKFGFWASLPLPFISESLQEIEAALAEGADGFVLLTNHHGHYLGDEIFDPIFALLNKHKATVFVHPTTPCMRNTHSKCTCNASDSEPHPAFHPATPLAHAHRNPLFEFFFDTARATTHLFQQHVFARHPQLTFVLPHAGGAFPPLISRISLFNTLLPPSGGAGGVGVREDEMRRTLRERVYFDLAGAVLPGQLPGMLAATGVGVGRLLYGSDYPFTGSEGVRRLAREMDEGLREIVATEEEMSLVYAKNAMRLLEITES